MAANAGDAGADLEPRLDKVCPPCSSHARLSLMLLGAACQVLHEMPEDAAASSVYRQ